MYVKKKISCYIIILFIFANYSYVLARVTGVCSNCHTMHASQTPWPSYWEPQSQLPREYLLVTDCIGCHSHNQSSTYYTLGECKVPVVFYTGSSAPTQYLAGGNFWWVKDGLGSDDTKGHNVFLNEGDDNLSVAPGYNISSCGTNCCHNNLHLPAQNTGFSELDGKYGCQGCHLNPKHHADDHENFTGGYVNNASQGWYRFLSGHMSGINHGVEGYEDGDWQASVSASDHNEYLGYAGDFTLQGGFSTLGNTITAFCTGCHGLFHEQNTESGGGSPWLRHPSDAVIPNAGEYANYTIYNPLAPVARPSSFNFSNGPSSEINLGQDMVMCLSCHRAHGSPYSKIMRWDYKNWPGGGTKGCNVCHTTKD